MSGVLLAQHKGICPNCKRVLSVRPDGRVWHHHNYRQPFDRPWCPGGKAYNLVPIVAEEWPKREQA